MKKTTKRANLGSLINALYEEFSKLTPNKNLQAKLVYVALLDMQRPRNRRFVRG